MTEPAVEGDCTYEFGPPNCPAHFVAESKPIPAIERQARNALRAELRAGIARLPGFPVFADDEYMCPNCVTPWKCNGPHIDDSGAAVGHLVDRPAVLDLIGEDES